MHRLDFVVSNRARIIGTHAAMDECLFVYLNRAEVSRSRTGRSCNCSYRDNVCEFIIHVEAWRLSAWSKMVVRSKQVGSSTFMVLSCNDCAGHISAIYSLCRVVIE
jgi:hypothetical protein